jgi:tRNA pseudouridine32 synthase/23S rRNA pseudouridine746 synthase
MSATQQQNHDLPGHGVPDGFQLMYADAALLVLVKPAGLLAVPGKGEDKQDCLSTRVQASYPDALVVHRLDMATSGLMLMARSISIQRALGALFERREIHKRYIAVVDGQPTAVPGADPGRWSLIDLPIVVDWPRRPLRIIDAERGKASQTRWRAVAFDAPSHSTRVELEPVTGRSHQLRVHLQALGHPILGDRLYAPQDVQARASRLLLHACALGLVHPVSGLPLQFDSPAPF